MHYRLIHIIILCLTPLYIYGQDIFSQKVSPVGGLSNYFVINLAIDGDGYVWVATESGLNRITGNGVIPFLLQKMVVVNISQPFIIMLLLG